MTKKTWSKMAKKYIMRSMGVDSWISTALSTGEVRVLVTHDYYEGWEADFDSNPIVTMDCDEMPFDRYDDPETYIHATGRRLSWDLGETWETEYEDYWTVDCESI